MLNNLLVDVQVFNLEQPFHFVMKKIVITLVVLGFAFSVNAQQSPLLPKQQPLKKFRFTPDSVAPDNFLFKQNPLQTFRFSPDNLNSNNPSFKLDSLRKNMVVRLNLPANANVDNMPIARMPGNSKMPIVQTDRTAYNMPVVGMSQPGIYTMKKPRTSPEVLPANNNDSKK